MIFAGKLTITLGNPVRIESTRGGAVSGLLLGRSAGEALALLPMLFSLCGHAHGAAARLAMGQGAADMALVLAEAAREHLLRIKLGWGAEAGGATMPPAPIMALLPDLQRHGTAATTATALENYLEAHVFGCPPERFLDGAEWLGAETQAAAYLRQIEAKGWARLGEGPPAPLPNLPPAELAERIQAPRFSDLPEWQGQPRETGPFARYASHPLVAAHGAGLMARLMARLVTLARLPAALRRARPLETPPGLGVVETARGRLVHWARLRDGVIKDYRILAPTEWNFHPEGVAARALAGLRAAQAEAMIKAIDPCVEFELRAA